MRYHFTETSETSLGVPPRSSVSAMRSPTPTPPELTSLVEVFTEPASGGYGRRQVLGVTDILRPTQLPGVEIPLADLPR